MQQLSVSTRASRVLLQPRRAPPVAGGRAIAAPRRPSVAARYRESDRDAERDAASRVPPGERDIDMTGGTGDYFIEFDDDSPLVRRAKQLGARAADQWERTTNKGEVLCYSAAVFLGIWVTGSLVDALDRLPLLPQGLKAIGTAYTVWFAWRYLLFHEGRADLARDLKQLRADVTAGTATAYMRAAEGAKPPAGAQQRLGDLDSASNLEAATDAARAEAAQRQPAPKGWGGEDE